MFPAVMVREISPEDREPELANQTWAFNKLERLKANICGYLEISTKQRFAEDLLA